MAYPPELALGYVIRYSDGFFDQKQGYPVKLTDATIYSLEEAQEIAKCLDHEPEIISYSEVLRLGGLASKEFVNQTLKKEIDFWENNSHVPDVRSKLEGLALSLLHIFETGALEPNNRSK